MQTLNASEDTSTLLTRIMKFIHHENNGFSDSLTMPTCKRFLHRILKISTKFILRPWLPIYVLILSPYQLMALQPLVKDPELARCIDEHVSRLQLKDPAALLDLQCSNRGITHAEGIEQLNQLQVVNLFNNRLQEFPSASLPHLKNLNLAGNQLTTLSLVNFPQLQTLLVFNNQLRILTLKNLPELTSLKGNGNQLLEWHYENLPKLEKITLFNNKMPTIDIYHLPALKIMDVRQNPMPDPLYDDMNKMTGVTFMHDGDAPDWK
jgi:hypothetical protein